MTTIAAIATPKGFGGIGIVRITGPDSKLLLARIFLPLSSKFDNFIPWHLHHGRILDRHGEELDDVLVVFMPSPNTFTGEDMAEIHCHGSPKILQEVLENLFYLGASQASRGEFTKRAFLNGKIDLSQAEAVSEIISAKSRQAVRFSLNRLDGQLGRKIIKLREDLDSLRVNTVLATDFPEDEVESIDRSVFLAKIRYFKKDVESLLVGYKRSFIMQDGAYIVLAGISNAGKSSLYNALIGRNRAIVDDKPGTTRDFLESTFELFGIPIVLIDTAGLRYDRDVSNVEGKGIKISREKIEQADCVILVLDGQQVQKNNYELDDLSKQILEKKSETPVLTVWNKIDIAKCENIPKLCDEKFFCSISAKNGINIDVLSKKLHEILLGENNSDLVDNGLSPNKRQAMQLEKTLDEITSLEEDILANQSWDLISVRIESISHLLEEVTGYSYSSEVLDKIFESFCIGK